MVPAPERDAGPPRILIVEDEPLVRAVLAESLRDAGFTVVEATHPEEAIAYIATAGRVDLVISDVRMPGPLDGVGLARQLKASHPSLPVILTSADLGARNIDDLGPFVQKPYRLAKIAALVAQILGSNPSDESDQ